MHCLDNCHNVIVLARETFVLYVGNVSNEHCYRKWPCLKKEQWTIFNEICMQTLQNKERHELKGCVILLSNKKVKYCWWHNNLQSSVRRIKQLMCRSWKQIPRVWQKTRWRHSERSMQRIELFDPNAVSRLEIFKHENTLAIKADDAALLVIN